MTDNRDQLVYHGELMENYACQVPVGGGNEFKTLADEHNRPLIFAIGEDRHLRLICQTDASAPWHLTPLTSEPVHWFAVAQNPDTGEIRVVYSTFNNNRSKLYYSRRRGNDRAALKTDYPFQWIEHPLDAAVVEINRIEIDFEHMMFACTGGAGAAFYRIAGFEDGRPGEELKPDLAAYADKISDFKVGGYGPSGIRGTYLLYDIGNDQTLQFESFPGTGKVVHRFGIAAGGRVSSIALIRRKGGADHLLACGASVRLFESDRVSHELIGQRDSFFRDIQTAQQDGYSSVWMIEELKDQRTRLLFLTDRYFDDAQKSFKSAPQWTSAWPFLEGVRQFSCIRGSSDVNHLILIDADNRLSHLYQDPVTTFWRRDAVTVESLDQILKFPCYTTRLIVSGQEDCPSVAQGCYVRASSQLSATINGAAYRLGPDNPAFVETDALGALTIIQPVEDDLTTPLLYVGFDGGSRRYVLDPTHKIEERLRQIQSAADFLNARTDEGKSLWAGGRPPQDKDLNAAASVIQGLLDSKKGFVDDELAKWSGAELPLRPDELWGVEFGDDGRVTYLEDQDAQKLLDGPDGKGFHPFRWMGHCIGTIIHGITSAFGKLRSFVVRQIDRITTFILNVAGEVIEFVVDTLEKVFPFLKTIFDAIGLVFSTLLHWLGRLLGWDDIWATHKTMALVTRNGAKSIETHVRRSVDGWKLTAHQYLEGLEDELQRISENNLPEDNDKHKSEILSLMQELFASPLFTWPLYMLMHNGSRIIRDLAIGTVLDSFMAQQAEIYDYVEGSVRKSRAAILDLAISRQFSSRRMLRVFAQLLEDILKTVDELIQGLLDSIAVALTQLQALFDDRAPIPFVGPFYKLIAGMAGEKEDFTFLNGFSLMLSVPLTIFYKTVYRHGRPYDGVADGFGEAAMFDAFWTLSTPHVAEGTDPVVNRGLQADSGEWDEFVTQYKGVGGVVGSFAGMFNGFLAFGKGEKILDEIGMILNIITHANTIPLATAAALDSKNKRAAYGFRLGQYFMSFIPAYVLPNLTRYKKGALATEKSVFSLVISVATLGTSITANVLSTPGDLSWIGQMMSRAGSLVTGTGVLTGRDPYVLLAGGMLSLSGGSCSLSNATIYEAKNLYHGTFV